MNKRQYERRIGMKVLMTLLLVILSMKVCVVVGRPLLSGENHRVFSEGITDGLEMMTNSFVEELIPMKTALDREKTAYKTKLLSFITKELLPAVHFKWGYDVEETLAVDNQDYLYLMEENEEENQEEMQKTELTMENKKKEKKKNTTTKVASNKEEQGKIYTKAQLYNTNFLLKNFYVVESTARLLPSEIDGRKLLNQDLTISLNGKKPKILIYHTHASETFKDSRQGNYDDTVVGVGSYLKELLEEEYQIPVYHDTTIYDIIDGKLDRSRAYNVALNGVEKILKENPSIDVVIDLHRDGIDEKTHLVTTVNGKQTAKIMFMNGISRSSKNGDISYLYNPNKEANLAFTLQMQVDVEKKYPDLMRKIYVKTYRYNLHVKPRSALVEVGANTNTLQEAKNAMIPLADMLHDVLIGK